MKTRKWILNIHLYAALICGPNWLIFSINSFFFNHPDLVSREDVGEPQTKTFLVPQVLGEDPVERAEFIKKKMGMGAWVHKWRVKEDEKGNLSFSMGRPGARYQAAWERESGTVTIERKGVSWSRLIMGLHTAHALKGSLWMVIWSWYSHVSIWVAIFCALSGLYLWWSRSIQKQAGWRIITVSLLVSFSMMGYAVWIG